MPNDSHLPTHAQTLPPPPPPPSWRPSSRDGKVCKPNTHPQHILNKRSLGCPLRANISSDQGMDVPGGYSRDWTTGLVATQLLGGRLEQHESSEAADAQTTATYATEDKMPQDVLAGQEL